MQNNNHNFAFFGTPALAALTLDTLLEHGYMPSVIITSPDTHSGRGMHLMATPVALWADAHNIPCLKPEKLDAELIEKLASFDLALSIVVAYGKILPEEIISLPSLGTINIHYSLLPKYRGASPVEAALLSGATVTGVSIQQMAYKLDSGPIITEIETPIGADETKETLRSRLTDMGAELLAQTLPDIFSGNIIKTPQDESGATYCGKIKKEDGELFLNGDPKINYNKYRAFMGWPSVYFFKDGKRIKITKARYENNSFIIERVVPEGKKETEYKES